MEPKFLVATETGETFQIVDSPDVNCASGSYDHKGLCPGRSILPDRPGKSGKVDPVVLVAVDMVQRITAKPRHIHCGSDAAVGGPSCVGLEPALADPDVPNFAPQGRPTCNEDGDHVRHRCSSHEDT